MSTIKPKDLKTIISYQKLCKNDAPVTTRATFKLSELKALITEIENHDSYKKMIQKDPNEFSNHSVSIVFTREKIVTDHQLVPSPMGYTGINPRSILLKNSIKKGTVNYTQLIPIIVGCLSELNDNYQNNNFKYLRNKEGAILFVHPGGEGSGLIPPPPKGKDE
jgi:hypothetical protein